MGNPVEISIAEPTQIIIEITASKSQIQHKPLPCDDPMQRCPDIALATQKLKWQPKTSLEDGLQKTIDYFRNLIG